MLRVSEAGDSVVLYFHSSYEFDLQNTENCRKKLILFIKLHFKGTSSEGQASKPYILYITWKM
jgi:hypothetical protein